MMKFCVTGSSSVNFWARLVTISTNFRKDGRSAVPSSMAAASSALAIHFNAPSAVSSITARAFAAVPSAFLNSSDRIPTLSAFFWRMGTMLAPPCTKPVEGILHTGGVIQQRGKPFLNIQTLLSHDTQHAGQLRSCDTAERYHCPPAPPESR